MTQTRHRWIPLVTRLAVVVGFLAVGAFIAWLLVLYKPQPAMRGPQAGKPTVAVFHAIKTKAPRQWRGFGTARAMATADVPARINTTVLRIPDDVEAGLPVKVGQLLVELDPVDYQQQVEVAQQRITELEAEQDRLNVQQQRLAERLQVEKSDAQLAKAEFDRVTQLFDRQVANQQGLDRAQRAWLSAQRNVIATAEALDQIPSQQQRVKAQIAAQQATLAIAQQDLTRTKVTSPITGVLEAVDVELGENVTMGQRLARVVALDRIEVPLQLPAAARPDLAIGDRAELKTTSGQACLWTGEIARISPANDENSRTVTAFVEFTQNPAATASAHQLYPGMFVEGTVIAHEGQEHWIVPRQAIRAGEIRVVQDGKVVSLPVDVAYVFEGKVPASGLDNETQWAALQGQLPQGQLVLIAAATSVLDGQEIAPAIINATKTANGDRSPTAEPLQ